MEDGEGPGRVDAVGGDHDAHIVQRPLRIEVVVERDAEADGILHDDAREPGRRGVPGQQRHIEHDRGVGGLAVAVQQRGTRPLGLGEVRLRVAVAVEVGAQHEIARRQVAQGEDPGAVGDGGVHHVAPGDRRIHPRVAERLAGQPVDDRAGNDIGGEVRSGREKQLERFLKRIAEHVLNDRQHRHAVDVSGFEPARDAHRESLAPVRYPHLARRRRHHHGLIQGARAGPLADTLAEAESHG